ncbi:hypothetical protein MAPG_02658 [Magnaporthiopsis poae ATCC 64411]|uniref:Uncharacterized protein n=1 Tax=Magnaporthiopsis poae (strain ATCC 64411 / 73-15) TaxID=644358 RepID=A0A0C4DRZ0_MAGP6|nr:hypothetical protein MAPG_02658 [Magnaporthiopsis poae ATCC 64411]
MGGNIFLARGLRTPRMPPVVYRHMVHTSQAALRKLFRVVCTPVDGPAKPDFGDVDILVADPLAHPLSAGEVAAGDGEANPTSAKGEGIPAVWDRIINALGAEHKIVKPHDNSAHLALPWPSHVDGSDGGSDGGSDEGRQEHAKFVQADVRICESEKVLRWVAFRHAHGDIWSILGSLIRPLGLTADETALWLRIPEIEDFHRKRARVLLTDDPHVALDLLGLSDDKGQWDHPFDSYEDLFNYVATCRFFYVSPHPSGTTPDGDAQDGPEQLKLLQELDAHGRPSSTVHGDARTSIKANDRRRMNSRPLTPLPRPDSSRARTDDGLWLVEDAAAFAAGRWRDIAPIVWEASQRRIAEVMRLNDLKRKAQEASVASSDDAQQQDMNEEPLSKKQATP